VPTGTERERQSEAKPKTKRTVDGARLPKCPCVKVLIRPNALMRKENVDAK